MPASRKDDLSVQSALDTYLDLLREGKYCDVTFLVGRNQEKIHCHELILKARSPVFEAMFSDRWRTDGLRKEIQVPEIEPYIFKMFLEFLYADVFNANYSDALHLLYVADKYEMLSLVEQCKAILKKEIKLHDALEVLQTARIYQHEDVMDQATSIIARNAGTFLESEYLFEMEEDDLVCLLSREDLPMPEVSIFKAVFRWGEKQIQCNGNISLTSVLKNILPVIRFPAMTLQEFTSVVLPTKLLPSETSLQLFAYFGIDHDNQSPLETACGFKAKSRSDAGLYVAFGAQPVKAERLLIIHATHPIMDFIRFKCKDSTGMFAIKTIHVKGPKDIGVPIGEVEVHITEFKPNNVRERIFWGDHASNNVKETKFKTTGNYVRHGKEDFVNVYPPVALWSGNIYEIGIFRLDTSDDCRLSCETFSRKENLDINVGGSALKLRLTVDDALGSALAPFIRGIRIGKMQ